jgi:tetratricopeptide (TPR) repeat protein
MRQERLRDAVGYFNREIRNYPAARPWVSLGQAYRELGQVDSAVFAFDRALSIDSTMIEAYLAHAQMAEEEGEFEVGLRYAKRAYDLAPKEPDTRYVLGLLLTKTGQDEAAIVHLQEVARQWPWHTESHYSLAQALQRVGRDEESREVLARAEQLWQRQAEVSYFQKTVSNDPDNPYNYAALATAFRMAGRYDDAVDAYKIALSLEPDNLEFRNNLASLHFLRQDTLAAIQTYRAIIDRDRSMVSAWLNLGVLYALSGEPASARQAWLEVLKHEPSHEQAMAYLARLEQQSK